jgi:predicted RNase H-like HicB family nuclease
MTRFLVIFEKGKDNYGAFHPDLPGCVATGTTLEEVRGSITKAITMHIQGMIEDQVPIPAQVTMAEYIEIVMPQRTFDD